MLVVFNRKYLICLNCNVISFEVVTLHSNASVSALLQILLSGQEVILRKRVVNLLRFALNLNKGVKTVTIELHFQFEGRDGSSQVLIWGIR